MQSILLDTDILSEVLKTRNAHVAGHAAAYFIIGATAIEEGRIYSTGNTSHFA